MATSSDFIRQLTETDDHSTDESSGHCDAEWSGTEGLVVIVCALFSGVISKSLLSGTRMPYTVLLTIFGSIMGVIHHQLENKTAAGKEYQDLSLFLSNASWTEVNPHVLLFVFLPILIFESALNCEWHIFKRQLKSILALAIPGVVISTVLTAAIIKLLHGKDDHWDWTAALTCGSILAATDPVAVVALMKELGVSERLGTLMEGESLLNDGTAIVVFGVFYAKLSENYQVCHAHSLDGGESIALFFRLSLGGVALGGVVGWLLQKSLSRVFNDPPTEVTLTVLAAFGVMLLAEGTVLEVSGVLAVVTLGLTMAAKGKFFISSCSVEVVEHFWSMLGYLANTVIFFVSGLIVAARAASDPTLLGSSLWRAVVLWILLHAVRAIMLFVLWPILSSGEYSFSLAQAGAVVYGGLRGAVGLTLALIVHEQMEEQRAILEEDHPNLSEKADRLGDEILFYVAIVAFLTLMVNGTTMEFVLNKLGLSETEEASARSLEQATAILSKGTVKALAKLKKHSAGDSDTDWAGALAYIPARSEESYKILRGAMEEELDLAEVGTSAMRKSLSMRELNVTENVVTKLHNKLILGWEFFKIHTGMGAEAHDDVNPLLVRIPGRLKERWMRYEQKWDSFGGSQVIEHKGFMERMSDSGMEMPIIDGDDLVNKAVSTEIEDMYELRRRFGISLKMAYHKLQKKGICEGATTASLIDGANRQLDDTEESKEHIGEHQRATSHAYKAAKHRGEYDMDESMGRPILGWYHLLDVVEVSMPNFLSSSTFAYLINTPGTRMVLKEVVAGRLGGLFEIVDGFLIGHSMALKQLTRREYPELETRQQRLEDRLRVEVATQQQLAKNMMDKLLGRFPEIARSIKTKKAARQLLAADRELIEKLKHEGRIEEGEEDELLEKNNISQKKLHDHPAGLTVPTKPDRIARHELFCRCLDMPAAKALAAIATERYFDPNAVISAQGTAATKWYLPIHGEFCCVRETAMNTNSSVDSQTSASFDSRARCVMKLAPNEEDVTPHWHLEDGMFLYSGDDHEHAHRLNKIISSIHRPMGLCNAPLGLGDALLFAKTSEQLGSVDKVANPLSTTSSSGSIKPQKRGSMFGAKASPRCSVTNSCDIRSPGHTQVLQIDAIGTWNLMKEHKSLRIALWRYVSASLVATNPDWLGQVIPAPMPPKHVHHDESEHLPGHNTIARALALSILPEQLRTHRSPIGKVLSLGKAAYTGDGAAQDDVDLLDGKISNDIAALLLLHGTLSVAYDENTMPRVITAPNSSVPADLDTHHCLIALGEVDGQTEMPTSKPSLLKASPGSVLLLLSGSEIAKVHAFARRVSHNATLQSTLSTRQLLHTSSETTVFEE